MLDQFQIGGSLASGSSSYVERRADKELIAALERNELCYVFNTRQIGKSSLLLKTKSHMQELGFYCSYVDISRIGSINITAEQWYAGLTFELWRNFSLPAGTAFFEWWSGLGDIPPPQKLSMFWDYQLPEAYPDKRFILFFDEVDSVISLPFAVDDFFSAIRSSYNLDKDESNHDQLNFALFGVALPADLVSEAARAPFNIGRAIPLDCFTPEEVSQLLSPMNLAGEVKEATIGRVLYWTGGQPFLTQKLLYTAAEYLAEGKKGGITEHEIDQLVKDRFIENWRNNDNPEHLKTIFDRITLDHDNNVQLLSDYIKVYSNRVSPESLSHYQRLYLTGLVHIKNKKVVVKNELYKTIFSKQWAEDELSRLRPYHHRMQKWLLDKSESHLLNEADLTTAKAWAGNHALPENDHKFLASSQEKLNQEVKQKNVQLEHEISQRKITEEKLQKALVELDIAKRQAESANKAKSHFLAKVSHEIRTHVNSIIGINYLARIQTDPSEYLKSIDRAASYLQMVINDLVDINQIERGELSFKKETFYIDSIFDNLININAPMIFDKGLDFLVDVPDTLSPAISGDPHRIEQVLSNLVANAIKYCPTGSISIGFKETGKRSDQDEIEIRFFVSDTGTGIGAENINTTIEDARSSPIEMGIGLTICCEMLSMMNSKLHVESVQGQGTTFFFSLRFDVCMTEELFAETTPKVGIPSTLSKEVVKTLDTIDCDYVAFDIEDPSFGEHPVDVFIVDDNFQQYQKQLLALNMTSKVELIPVLRVGDNIPHWLNTLNYRQRIDLPITPRKLHAELMSFKRTENEEMLEFPEIEQAGSYRILVAEDDEINQEVIRSLLSMFGLKATIVNNGSEAVQAASETLFDLVLMDIEMPVMGGIEAVKQLRSESFESRNEKTKQIPIIAMTAHALLGDKQRFIQQGMNDHLGKPIEPSKLQTVLREWLPSLEVHDREPTGLNFPAIDGIQVEDGLRRCNDNIPLYRSVLSKFAQKYRHTSDLEKQPLEKLQPYFHTVKGTSGNIGASAISRSAAALESKCINDEAISQKEFVRFSEDINAVCSNIEEMLNAGPGEPTGENAEDSAAYLTAPVATELLAENETEMAKPKIIIVDDQPENLQILVEILKSEFAVIATTSPSRALELARRKPEPSAILLDVVMPELDGFTLCEKLKAMPEVSDVPVLFVTSSNSELDYRKGFSSGGEDFIQKPVSAALLLNRLRRAMGDIPK